MAKCWCTTCKGAEVSTKTIYNHRDRPRCNTAPPHIHREWYNKHPNFQLNPTAAGCAGQVTHNEQDPDPSVRPPKRIRNEIGMVLISSLFDIVITHKL